MSDKGGITAQQIHILKTALYGSAALFMMAGLYGVIFPDSMAGLTGLGLPEVKLLSGGLFIIGIVDIIIFGIWLNRVGEK